MIYTACISSFFKRNIYIILNKNFYITLKKIILDKLMSIILSFVKRYFKICF